MQDIGVSVDKEELKKALRYDRQQYEKGYADAKQAAIDALSTPRGILYPIRTIESLPSAQPERKTGKWENVEGWDGDVLYRCSECGTEFVLIDGTPEENDYHFCPNCGARMEKNDG